MPSIEKGVVLREYTVRKPSSGMVEMILNTQAQQSNRFVRAEWGKADEVIASTAINPSQLHSSREIREMANAFGGADRLTIQEVLSLDQ